MVKVMVMIGLVAICLIVSLVLVNNLSNTPVNQTYAQAALVAQQGQARLDTAMAAVIVMNAAAPWFVLGLLGLGVITLAIMVFLFLGTVKQRETIRQIVYLPPPQLPRMQVYRALSDLGQSGFEVEVVSGELVKR